MEEAGVKLIAQGSDAFGADMKAATKAVDGFGVETKKAADLIQDAAGRWRTASGKFATDAEKAAAGVATVAPAAKKAGDAAKQAGDDAEKGGRGFDVFGDIVTGAMHRVGAVAVEAFGQALKATAAFVGDSIGLAGDFEAGMLNFQAVAGKDVNTEGLEDFRDLFLQIGKELPVSTAEVQNAATEMIKGGIDPAIVAAGGLRQNIQFAAAAMEGDLVAAAEISGKILGGWADASATAQEKADFLTHSTNLLTKAANASAVDVKGLSLGIFNAQGIAKTAGVSFDDLTTTLAALAPRFASSSEAGNSLKNMIARLQPQTKTAAGYMLDLGLITEEGGNKFYDANGKFVGFEKTSQILKESLVGLTEQQKTLYLQQIFGNDAMGSAAALADMGAAGYANMADAMAKANGVAENAALKQQGFNTAMDNAKGSVEALQITVGSYLLPVLTDLINNVVAPGINVLTDMADAVFGNDEAFNRLSPTMQDVVSTIGTLIDDVQNIIGAFDDAGAMSSEFGESIGLLASDLGLPGELIQDIVFVTQDVVKWFDKAGGESDALGSAVTDLSGIWDKALVVVGNVADGYMNIAEAVLPIVAGFIDEHGTEISAFFQTTWDTIAEIVNLALDVYNNIVPPVLNAVAGFISEHTSEIQKVLSGAWTMITSLITGTLDTIKGIFKVTLAVINGDWEGAWIGVKDIAKAQVTAIGGIVTGFLDLIAGLFDTSMAEIGQTWQHNWDMLVDIATQTDWGAVGASIVSGILSGLRDNWASLTGWVSEKISGLVDSALEAIGAGSPAVEFMPVGQFAVQGIMVGFQNMMPQLTSLVSELGDDLVGQASDIASEVQNGIADAFGATASIDRQKVANLRALSGLKGGAGVQSQINEAEKVALAMNDPKQAAEFFKLRSGHLIELGKLNDQIQSTTDRAERERLIAQYDLINAAQNAEMSQLRANQSAQGGGTQSIADQLRALLMNKDIPGILESSTVNALTSLLGQMISPPASGGQIGAGTTNSYSQQRTYNMPIYTNQSPQVLQQSWAIMQASMP